MNPYEPPQTIGEQIREPYKRRRFAVWAMCLAAGLILGGLVTVVIVRIEMARTAQVKAIRSKLAAEAEARRVKEAAENEEGRLEL